MHMNKGMMAICMSLILIAIFTLMVVESNSCYVVVERLEFEKTPADIFPNGKPWGGAEKRWNEEFDWHFYGKVKNDFNGEEYKKKTGDLFQITKNREGGLSVDVLSKKEPNKSIFPNQIFGRRR